MTTVITSMFDTSPHWQLNPALRPKDDALGELIAIAKPEDPPEVISLEEYHQSVEAEEMGFGALDFHTAHSGCMQDPFEVVAEIERRLGAPIALCTTVIVAP